MNTPESPGAILGLLEPSVPLAWPTMITFAAARLARAWEAVKKDAERGQSSEVALIEMHRAALRLMAVTRTKDLWAAIDAVGDIEG